MIREILALTIALALVQIPCQAQLRAVAADDGQSISVYRDSDPENAILTQNAKPDFRPYLHPIVAPDGKGLLTQYSPGHHKHQTGHLLGLHTRQRAVTISTIQATATGSGKLPLFSSRVGTR